MQYISYYKSPLGELLLTGGETGLDGLWFEGAKYQAQRSELQGGEKELSVFVQTKEGEES